jgi:hypothetical protein
MAETITSGSLFNLVVTLENLVERPPHTSELLRLLNLAMERKANQAEGIANQALAHLALRLEVEELGFYEEMLNRSLSDRAILTLVLTAYALKRASPNYRAARYRLVARIAEEWPRIDISASYLILPLPRVDDELLSSAGPIWLKQVERNPEDAQILCNAALFMLASDELLSVELLRRCKQLEPSSARWPFELGCIHLRQSRRDLGIGRKNWAAAIAVGEFQNSLTLASDGDLCQLTLIQLADVAFEAGFYDKSREAGEQLLARAATAQTARERGAAVYRGNLILGRVAACYGDLDRAKHHLSQTFSPVNSRPHVFIELGQFNMALAKDLLRLGERETVIDYIGRCAAADRHSRTLCAKWISQIESGGEPDFGKYLYS